MRQTEDKGISVAARLIRAVVGSVLAMNDSVLAAAIFFAIAFIINH